MSRAGVQARRADVVVHDPSNAVADPKLPFLSQALDPCAMQPTLSALLEEAGRAGASDVSLAAIRVVRHKAGRRCLVEYELDVACAGAPSARIVLLGKVRARGVDEATFRLNAALRCAGFTEDGVAAAAVPEPVGLVPELSMWVQTKVLGQAAAAALSAADGEALARRVAEAIHALHTSGVPARRQHRTSDELEILRDRLGRVASSRPAFAARVERLADACERLAADIVPAPPCGIHRDFYPDQVLVGESCLYLLDLDLYAAGDPALDIGNFTAHLAEESLRKRGDPAALCDREQALEERYLELAGPARRADLHAYATLTLARHVYITTLFEDRAAFTGDVLSLCEERLDLRGRAGS